jgi:hypothetical protein
MDILDQYVRENEQERIANEERQPHYIDDVREEPEFRDITFSEFKKTDGKKAFAKAMVDGSTEEAMYWCGELVCAGHYLDIWDTVMTVVSRHIHTGNPKLPILVASKYELFRAKIEPYISGGMFLKSRNDTAIRDLFCELVVCVCLSSKRRTVSAVKINKQICFELPDISARIRAPSTRYIESIFDEDDPNELHAASNEFAFHISTESGDLLEACYWVEWIIAVTARYKQARQPLECVSRQTLPTEYKFQKEPIGIIWICLINECKERRDKLTTSIIDALMRLFYVRYTPGVVGRRKFLIYMAVDLIVDVYSKKTPLVSNRPYVDKVLENANHPYTLLKRNEHSSGTDYLSVNGGGATSEAERSMDRIAKLNQMIGL